MTLSSYDSRTGVTDVSFSPDGTRVAVAGRSSTAVTVWDVGLSGSAEVATLPATGFGWNAVTFDVDGAHFFATGPGDSVNVWDARTFAPLAPVGGSPSIETVPSMTPGVPMSSFGNASHIAATPDGRLIATLADQGRITGTGVVPVWEVETGDPVFTARVGSFANFAAWSPHGRTLAIAGGEADDGSVTWTARVGRSP